LRPGKSLQNKILTLPELKKNLYQWRLLGKTIVFTNGCFDILHEGHIASLTEAAGHGEVLVVGLNSDDSVKKLKGADRPFTNENSRAAVLAALAMVDAVVLFDDPTPLELILAIKPDVLAKGSDYKTDDIAGGKEVKGWGGTVVRTAMVDGISTTAMINKIQNL
jgi:D-glycero-beta-D-manno-heptose 1-phosphate adenylyltransferase